MKKKILSVILILALVIIIVLGVMYFIDRNRMENNEPVLFSTWGYKYAPPIDKDEMIEEETDGIITETLVTPTSSNGTSYNTNGVEIQNQTVSSNSNEILVTHNTVEPNTTVVTVPGKPSGVTSNSTLPYDPSNSVIETPDGLATVPSPANPNMTVTNPSEPVEINRSLDKVSMEVIADTVTKTGATIVITDKNEVPYSYGTWFRIDKKVASGWEKLETIRDDVSFYTISFIPNDDGVLQNKENWTNIYGELEPGEYRLVKEIYENGSKYIYAEFSIEE